MKTLTTFRALRTVLQTLIVLTPLLGAEGLLAQTTYTWDGSSGTAWTTAANWTPSGTPTSSDYVVIVSATNAPVLPSNKTVARFKISSGTMNLNGYTLTVTDKLELLGGTTTAGKIVQSASNIANVNNATVNCKLDLIATTVTFQYATCTDSVKVKQTTTSGTITWRGNRFEKHLDVENTSNGNMNMGYNPPDSCFDGLTLRGGRIRPGYAHPDNYIDGDVVVYDSGTTGTYMAIASGNEDAVLTVTGDIIIDKTGLGELSMATAGTGGLLYQSAGKSIIEGSTGYTTGAFKIKGLHQLGTGGGISLTAGASTQVFEIMSTAELGSLTLDIDDVTVTGAEVKGAANVVADRVRLTANEFLSASSFTKTGASHDHCGGNRFVGPTTLRNESTTQYFRFAHTTPDTAFSSLTLYSSGERLNLGYDKQFVAMGSVYCNEDGGNIRLGEQASGGIFVLAGPGLQTFAPEQGGPITAEDVRIDKPSGQVRLTGELIINDTLELFSGIVLCVDSGQISLTDNAKAIGTSDLSYIEGSVKKTGNDVFSFPIGRNGIYQPLTISAPSTTGHVFVAEYFDHDSDTSYTHSSRDGSIAYLDRTQYWMFDKPSGTGGVYVTLGWRDVACGISSISDPDVCAWNGTQWKNLGNANEAGTVVTGTAGTEKTSSMYGAYTWGNFSGISAQAGPDRVMEAGDTVSIGIMVQPAWDYDWDPSATVEEPDSAITLAYPSTKTQYVLAVTGENSCVATDTMVVYITVLPEDTVATSASYLYVENKGQLLDMDRNDVSDIHFYNDQVSPSIYLRESSWSFVLYDWSPDTSYVQRVDVSPVNSGPATFGRTVS